MSHSAVALSPPPTVPALPAPAADQRAARLDAIRNGGIVREHLGQGALYKTKRDQE